MSRFIPIELIKIAPNRQRREFDPLELNELGESIVTNQLLHAPVIRERDGEFLLVAGERRLRAMRDLHDLARSFRYANLEVPHGMIPVSNLGELSESEAYEAELEENLRRVDLTWQEKAEATTRLAELRTLQADENNLPLPTVRQIAEEVRPGQAIEQAHQTTRQELIVSKFLKDPEVAAAPTLKEAFKILKKREERTQNAALAATIGSSFSSKSHTLLNADSVSWLASPPPELVSKFAIILTDPPYGMGADEFGDSGKGTAAEAHFYDDSYENWQRIMDVFCRGIYHLASDDAHAYIFCDFDRFAELRQRMTAEGWKVHRTPIVWHNPDGFRCPWPEQGPQRKYELILYAVKGSKKVRAVLPDVISCPKDKGIPHPAAKPQALLEDLLRRSAMPGDRVLDPFVGSGQTIRACHELKLSCTALELDPAAYGLAAKALSSLSAYDEGLF